MTTTVDLTYDLSLLYSVWPAAANGGERIGFADVERLCAYLLRLTDDAKREPPPTDE